MSPVLGVLVSAALALGPAPARLPQRFEDLEALVSNLAAEQRYEALAAAAERAFARRDLAAAQRRLMAFHAIRGLHGVYEGTGKVANLCRAQRLLRRVEREVGLDEDASTAARLGRATAKLLAASGTGEKPCSKSAAKPPPAVASRPPATPAPATSAAPATSEVEPPRAVASQPPAASEAEPPPAVASRPPASPTPAPTLEPPVSAAPGASEAETTPAVQDDLVAVTGRPIGRAPKDMSHKTRTQPAVEGPASAPVEASTPPQGQDRSLSPRTRGGIALLSVGAAASAALGASLHYRGQTNDRIAALTAAAEARGHSTPEEYAEADRLNQNYRRLTAAAWTTGVVAALGLITGVTLLAVKQRRTTTAAAPWAGPTGAGLTLRGHF